MNSKQIVKMAINHENPPRPAMDMLDDSLSDIQRVSSIRLVKKGTEGYKEWGKYPELLNQVPNFNGEVRLDDFGNIYGRLEGKTKGECVKGALEEDWDLLDSYEMPKLDYDFVNKVADGYYKNSDKYVLAGFPAAVFSTLRDLRLMENALMDTVTDADNIRKLLEKVVALCKEAIEVSSQKGVDGMIMFDDWGMQHTLFINPKAFREIFKPAYAKLAEACHKNSMDFFLHSCGNLTEIIPDLIEVNVDVLQFDQPELYGSKYLSELYGEKVCFYSPVDIQLIMPTGDKKIIEGGANNMLNCFETYAKNSLIIKDYPSLSDIDVEYEWAVWVHDILKKKYNV